MNKTLRALALLLALLLALSGTSAADGAPEPFDPEEIGAKLEADLKEYYPNISASLTLEADEDRNISFLIKSASVATLYFNHILDNGTIENNGVKNNISLLVVMNATDQDTAQVFVSIFTVFAGALKHVLYPEKTEEACATEALEGLQAAAGASEENVRTVTYEDGKYRQTFSFSMLSAEVIFLSYSVKIVGLD